MSKVAELLTRAADVKAHALTLDTSTTETVTMADLKIGDVITHIGPADGGKTFPFPYTLTRVTLTHEVAVLCASHGWFGGPYPQRDAVIRVAV